MGDTSFRPPINSPFVSGFVKLMLPMLRKVMFGDLKVQFDPDDIQRLHALKGERMLLLPNHPGAEDPLIMFALSRQLNEPFNYVAAREVFDFHRGFHGYLLQRCGAYSVIRGASDRESFKMTRNILYTGSRRLVIFIEGEVSYDNEGLIPFQQGVLQLAFKAQEDLVKDAKKNNRETISPVYVAPVTIKYVYHDGIGKTIGKGIAQLEKAVGLDSNPEQSDYERLRAVGEKIIEVRERYFDIDVPDGATLDDRMNAIKDKSLRKMEGFLGLTPQDPDLIPRIRAIRNKIDRIIHTYDDTGSLSYYEKHILDSLTTTFSEFYEEMDRLVNFLTYREGYVLENESPERYMELIRRIEKEIFRERLLLHPRTAVVKVGEIINLHDHYAGYTDDKKKAAENLCIGLETDMLTMLRGVPDKEPVNTA